MLCKGKQQCLRARLLLAQASRFPTRWRPAICLCLSSYYRLVSCTQQTFEQATMFWILSTWWLSQYYYWKLLNISCSLFTHHRIVGGGLPFARHFSVTFAPSRTTTSVDVWASSMFGGTADMLWNFKLHHPLKCTYINGEKKLEKSCRKSCSVKLKLHI